MTLDIGSWSGTKGDTSTPGLQVNSANGGRLLKLLGLPHEQPDGEIALFIFVQKLDSAASELDFGSVKLYSVEERQRFRRYLFELEELVTAARRRNDPFIVWW